MAYFRCSSYYFKNENHILTASQPKDWVHVVHKFPQGLGFVLTSSNFIYAAKTNHKLTMNLRTINNISENC